MPASILFFIFLICGYCVPSLELKTVDSKLEAQKKELELLEEKIKSGKKRLLELENSQKISKNRVFENRKILEEMTTKSKETEMNLEQTKKELVSAQNSWKEAEKKYLEYQEVFFSRLNQVYAHRNQPFLKILLGTESFGDFSARLHWYKQIVETDSGHFSRLKDLKTSLKKIKQELEIKKEELDALFQQMIQEKNSLLAKIQSDKDFLQKSQKEQELLTERAEKLKKSSEYLEDKIKNLQSAKEQIKTDAFLPKEQTVLKKNITQNSLNWPILVKNRIKTAFGRQNDSDTTIFNPGLDIVVDADQASIHATEDGIIFYKGTPAGNSATYGKVIMVAHGNYDGKFITLYGNLSTILVALNQSVKKGDKIATISRGQGILKDTETRLHFQVRVNGEPENPTKWLKRQ